MHSVWLRHHAKFLVPAVLFTLFFLHVELQSDSRIAALYGPSRDDKAVFVDNFLLHEAEGPFNGSSIADLCASKKWTPGLVLSCEAVPGDLADVKSGILTCLRTAIELGAAVVLPDILRRSETDVSNIIPQHKGPHKGVDLTYFFDRAHLRHILDAHCPQMDVYDSLDPFFEQPSMVDPVRIDLAKLPGLEWRQDLADRGARVLAGPQHLAQCIRAYVDDLYPVKGRRYPFHLQLRPTPQYVFSASADPPACHAAFGRLLRVRPDLRRLAAGLLYRLHEAAGLPLPGTRPGHAFAAVELRTAADAVKAKFPAYAVQASDLLPFLVNRRARVVLLGTGATAEDEALFVDRADDFNMTVVRKADLATGADAAQLRELSWDQLGLVDYEMMMYARLVAGTAHSNFAWNLALRRHLLGGVGNGTASTLENVRWQDERTTLFGKETVGDSREQTIWP